MSKAGGIDQINIAINQLDSTTRRMRRWLKKSRLPHSRWKHKPNNLKKSSAVLSFDITIGRAVANEVSPASSTDWLTPR